jgi:uncharacterized ferritin-like protein (DUF455 family)
MEFNFDALLQDGCARSIALRVLAEPEPGIKAQATRALHAALGEGRVSVDRSVRLDDPGGLPGRPVRPELVPPRLLDKRSVHTEIGRAVLLHALAHIEFNAINLALDAVWRFDGMPEAYYGEWLRVAAE